MKRSFTPEALREIDTRLAVAHKAFARRYPGLLAGRQPVHVVYGGAHLFRSGISRRLGDLALRSLDEYAPDFVSFANVFELGPTDSLPAGKEEGLALGEAMQANAEAVRRENFAAWFAYTIYERVRQKLRREAVEDFRIDFEDGYGIRADAEEDSHAAAAANEVAHGMNAGELPPFIGIRIKAFSEATRARSIRTLDIVLTELAAKIKGELPANFCVTLPKVALPDEAAALADICSRLEPMLDLTPGALRIELMIETPQAVVNERGEINVMPLVSAMRGRCAAIHFGPYDYTALRGLSSSPNLLRHFASDFAREAMQVALSGTGVRVSDGPTSILPVPVHRAEATLTPRQFSENREAIHRAWKLHFDNVRRSIANGFHQSWDLHPAQLPARYAAVYSFFLEDFDSVCERLRNFIERAARAALTGQVFDDAAIVQGLVNHVLQAVGCGAITAEEAEKAVGTSIAELRSGAFLRPKNCDS